MWAEASPKEAVCQRRRSTEPVVTVVGLANSGEVHRLLSLVHEVCEGEGRKTINPPIHQSTANYRALLSSVLRNGFGVPIRARASTACKLRVHAVRHPGASAAMAADPIPEG